MKKTLFDEPEAPAPSRSNRDIVRLLGLIAKMSGNRQLAEQLAELGHMDLGDADEQHWLHGPLVVHATAWTADIPEWCLKQAIAERWAIVAGDLQPHIVGPAEIVCVMMGAIMEAPRHTEVADLYIWAGTAAAIRHYGKDSEQAKSAIKNAGPYCTDKDVFTPGGRLYQEYRELASEIRRKVARCHREEARADRKATKDDAKLAAQTVALQPATRVPAKTRPIRTTQFSMFDLKPGQ